MGNKIEVNSNGGTVSFGNIIQGNRNRAGDLSAVITVDAALEKLREDVQQLAKPVPERAAATPKVMEHVDALGEEAKQAERSVSKGAAILKTIRENWSWAYPAVKEFVVAAWPALVALL